MQVHQINLQPAVGGGEVYTRWFSRALADAGASVFLYVHESNRFWDGLASDRIRVIQVDGWQEVIDRLPSHRSVVITQSRIPTDLAMRTAQLHLLTGFAHMPMIGRSAEEFRRYATVFTVSRYCIDLLRESGISSVYPHALYGTGILDRVASRDTAIKQKSAYHWDMRKGRDRLLALAERILGSGRSREPFDKRAGLTLGIVSLLSPIKQFPMLFDIIAPHLAQYSQVNLEIFGSGGYAQVRDLKRSLLPMTGRVRLWGYHEDVENIYPQLDYLLTGLPEKEALGLNVLEAQTLGTPALAPAAPPFTETIVHEANGFLYRDPRTDGGVGFNELIASIVGGRPRPDPLRAVEHLAKFSYETMVERAKLVIAHLERSLSSSPHHLG